MTSRVGAWVIPAGTEVIAWKPGESSPQAVRLSEPMRFARLPAGSGQWVTLSAPDGGCVRVRRTDVRTETSERHRIDAHGWRDDDTND